MSQRPSFIRLSNKLWLIPLAVLTLTVCKSKNRLADPPPEAAEVPVVANESVLVEDGQSSQPSFSVNGDYMLFVSAGRPGHSQPQVYERDMKNRTEKRITFQSGSTWHPRYHPKDRAILYSSSTDELKENSPLLTLNVEAKPSKLPPPLTEPLDVYLHSLNGLEIKRVSHKPGFDGEANFSPDGKNLVWTRIVKERAQIVSLPHSLIGEPRVIHGLGDNPTAFTTSPDGKSTAWIDWDPTFGVSRLRVRQGKSVTDVAADMIVTKRDPEFSPDSKWLVWAQKDPQTNLHGIWGYDLAGKCLHHFLFSSEGDRLDPIVSPDMKFLTYTWVSRGRSRIAQVPFVQRSGPCPVPP